MGKHVRLWLLMAAMCVLAGLLLRATAEQGSPRTAAVSGAARAATRAPVGLPALTPRAPGSLQGVVHAAGAAVADARVCAACVHCEPTRAPSAVCTRSGHDGRYSLRELAPGSYFVHATAIGFSPGTARDGRPVPLEAGDSLDHVDVVLVAGGARLGGVVMDATGGTIAGARVRALRLTPPRISLDVESDAQGRFELWLQPGFIAVSAEADGYSRAMLHATAPSELELRLIPGASIEGQVVLAETGEPVAQAEVRAPPPENPQLALASGSSSDDGGRFRIDGLDPGRYLLTARTARARGTLPDVIELGIAEHASGVLLELKPAAEVRGRVVLEAGGEPCPQGFVALGDPDPVEPMPSESEIEAVHPGAPLARATGPEQVAEIDVDGGVQFRGVPPGYYFASVQCTAHVFRSGPRVLRVTSDPIEGLTWTVSRGASLRVEVLDARREPVADAQFLLEYPSPASNVVSAYETDGNGTSRIDGLADGTYRLFVAGEPASTAVSVTVDATREAAASLQLSGSATILAEVRDDQGRPLDGLRVSASPRAPGPLAVVAGAPVIHALALGEGRYRIGPASDGAYELSIDDGVNPPPDPARDPALRVDALAGRSTVATVVLPRSGVLRGKVSDERGLPVADVWVSVKPSVAPTARGALRTFAAAQASQHRVLTDLHGRFVIAGLAPDARFEVRALEPYGRSALQAHASPGDELRLRLAEKSAPAPHDASDDAESPTSAFLPI